MRAIKMKSNKYTGGYAYFCSECGAMLASEETLVGDEFILTNARCLNCHRSLDNEQKPRIPHPCHSCHRVHQMTLSTYPLQVGAKKEVTPYGYKNVR